MGSCLPGPSPENPELGAAWEARTSGEKFLLPASFPDFSSGMAALAALLLPVLGAGIIGSGLTFFCPMGNPIPQGVASSEGKIPFLGQLENALEG